MNWEMRKRNGYTLIELIVVIVIIGLVMTLMVPQFREAVLTDNLKSTVRKMVGLLKTIREDAIRDQRPYDLRFDLESNRFWVDSPKMSEEERALAHEQASSFPSDVRILDVWTVSDGKKTAGETRIRFTSKGYVQQSAIHLGSDDDRLFTLVLSPFQGTVEVLEEYVDFQ
jgi:type II secretion system protein H